MEKIKRYFSRINWWAVLLIFVLVNFVNYLDGTISWVSNAGLLLFVCIVVPLYSIYQQRIRQMNDKHNAIFREEEKVIEEEKKRETTVEYLSTMCYEDRMDILKEVQLKTKGNSHNTDHGIVD